MSVIFLTNTKEKKKKHWTVQYMALFWWCAAVKST